MARSPAAVVVFVTAGSRAEATRLAEALVSERLAACVNVIEPVTSIYLWQGKMESAGECLLLIKTRRALLARLTARVKELHSYELPEVIAIDVIGGATDYLSWLVAQTHGS